jgi:hypothetical protein
LKAAFAGAGDIHKKRDRRGNVTDHTGEVPADRSEKETEKATLQSPVGVF